MAPDKIGLIVCSVFTFTSLSLWHISAAAYTEPTFWFFFIFAIWLYDRDTDPLIIGAMLGMATFFRMQAAFAFIAAP